VKTGQIFAINEKRHVRRRMKCFGSCSREKSNTIRLTKNAGKRTKMEGMKKASTGPNRILQLKNGSVWGQSLPTEKFTSGRTRVSLGKKRERGDILTSAGDDQERS